MGVLPQNRKRGLLLGQEGNTLMALIAINAILFVLINFIKITYFLSGMELAAYYRNALSWFVVPASLEQLAGRPWTLLSYMFSHDGVWSMISNMLWLWAFGYILQDLTGNRHLAPIYLYGGFIGAIFFLVTVNLFPVLRQSADVLAPLQGGGAAIMAVAVATTALAPGYRIFPMLHGGIPLWVLTLIFVLVDYALMASANAGVGVAHLAGGLMGLLYMRATQRGADWGEWMHQLYQWFFNLFNPDRKEANRRQQQRQQVHYQADRQPFTTTPHISQSRVDELLDKINQKGYHFLTDEEKAYLKRASSEEL